MWRRAFAFLTLMLVVAILAFGNEKKKPVLPVAVVNSRTVVVLIDPDAGVSTSAPLENKTALEDVEKALEKWGRLNPVMSGMPADFVIVIRKGNGKPVQPTIHGGPSPNDRPVVIQPNDTGIRIGGQKGRPPSDTQTDPQTSGTGPGVAVGASEDSFVVYDGTVESPLDRAPIWRYVSKNALHSPDVPAVDEFRKIFTETEKQQQPQQKKP